MKTSKPKGPQCLRIINLLFFLFFVFLFLCYFCSVKAQFGTSGTPICCRECRHGPPNTKQQWALQVVPALLPSRTPHQPNLFPSTGMPCQALCHLGSLQTTACCLSLSGKAMQWQDDVQRVHVSFIRIVYLLSLQIRTIYFKWFPAKSTGLSFSKRSWQLCGTSRCVSRPVSSSVAWPASLFQDHIRYTSIWISLKKPREHKHIFNFELKDSSRLQFYYPCAWS